MFKNLILIPILVAAVHLSNLNELLLKQVMLALNNNLDFILDNSNDMNIDGLYGVNLAQADLRRAFEATDELSFKIDLTILIDKCKKIWETQKSNVPNSPFKYFVFKNFVAPPEYLETDIKYTHGKIKPVSEVDTGTHNITTKRGFRQYMSSTNLDFEEKSDACLVEVATAGDIEKPHRCPLSPACVDYLIKFPNKYSSYFPAYGVTHMLLLLRTAKNSKCIVNNKLIDRLITTACSYVFWEMKINIEFGYIEGLDDLFLEQVDVCGREGFTEFLKLQFLERILKIQEPQGCFSNNFPPVANNGKRRKRDSNEMKYGCNSHTTGLGSSTLGLFIRFLIETAVSPKQVERYVDDAV